VDLDPVWMGLAGVFGEQGFRIEQIHLAGTAVLDQLDDGFCPTGKVALAGAQVVVDRCRGGFGSASQQVRERNLAEAQ